MVYLPLKIFQNMSKQFLGVCALLFFFSTSYAQRDIEPQLIYNDTASFNFTGEWQYLSTDIFLFNGDKFSNVINDLEFVKNESTKKKRKKSNLEQEELEYLFITANLKNVKFFGDKNITYPLYNFQINRDADKKYHTYVSDNIDHIRIIDNLPLYSASDYIDADLNVKAITNNDRDQILGLVASQLKNLSNLTTPTSAVLSIIGEFGSFIESNTKKKEYQFNSTIRLFEQKNFDSRIHSIKVYSLTTTNSPKIELDTNPFRSYLDTVNHTAANRQILSNLISCKDYPIIVVVNYKSLYKIEPLSGDEVTFANIEKRKLDIENDYRQSLINAETYRQEKDFITFLTVYANLKNYLDVYTLNYRTGNSDATAGSLFKVMQYFRQLNKTYTEMAYKYKGNSTFKSIFEPEYESILGFASLYLDNDHNLKSTKELVNTLILLENSKSINKNELESQITALRFSGIFKPEMMKQNMEGQLISSQINILEEALYKYSYEAEVQKLNSTVATLATQAASEKLLRLVNNTSCGRCRDRSIAAINSFGQRIDAFKLKIELIRNDSIVEAIQPWIFKKMEQLQLIQSNFDIKFAVDSSLESTQYLSNKILEAKRDLNNLNDFVKIDVSDKDVSTVINLNGKLLSYKKQVEQTLNLICNLKPELCGEHLKKENVEHNKLSEAFTKADSTIRQTNIFIAIFDSQIRHQYGNPDTLTAKQVQIADSTKILLSNLKTTVNLLETCDPASEIYNKLEREVNQLTIEISNRLSNGE